jgi:hypothetical protein
VTPAKALDFNAAGHLYATHGLHAFAARFPPPLVDWAITKFSEPGSVVLDPMVGSGTTLVEAALLGRAAWGADIDPLARLIANSKATPVDPDLILDAGSTIERLFRDGVLDDTWRPALPDLEKWFRPEVASDLSRLRAAIPKATAEESVQNLLWTVFSSIIVARTSVANVRDLVHSRHHYRAWSADPGTLSRFLSRLGFSAKLMADYRERLRAAPRPVPEVRIVGNDARDLPISDESVDLIVTSPPYCSALDYTRAHIFAVAWMPDVLKLSSDEYRLLGRQYVGSERAALSEASKEQPLPPPLRPDVDVLVKALQDHPKRAWIVYRYFRDMELTLREFARVLRHDHRAVLVVCPSNIRKVRIPTHEIFTRLAPQATQGALVLEDLHERTIHDHRRVMPYLETAFGERMRTEYVLVLRRSHATGVPGP